MRISLGFLALLAVAGPALAQAKALVQPPSVVGTDAPQLAAMGPSGVGFRTLTLVHRGQPMLEAGDPKAVVALAGARDHYQLPLALHEDGLLEKLVTDMYWPADKKLFSLTLNGVLSKELVSARFCPGTSSIARKRRPSCWWNP